MSNKGPYVKLEAAKAAALLGVRPDADLTEIRKGWVTTVRWYHPDKAELRGHPENIDLYEAVTKAANAARDLLRACANGADRLDTIRLATTFCVLEAQVEEHRAALREQRKAKDRFYRTFAMASELPPAPAFSQVW